ncbi:hypothetical protein FEDK69T_31340 [Flavobacterium enshiense DK69]|uniref:zinc ribbon domain-containing protein n=1 Tax=Flavobacterium enshiense TaxID=1341165 RepID=UPI0003C59452|nr:zinc ribbon domain-containing protein [Flavobacterium enshiense]ESU19465.1 hypothetical protein FEDK69T_31340 [Flavobacterium enshiense DK69]
MSINIPDKISKLLVLLGILLIVFGVYRSEQSDEKYFEKIDLYNQWRDSISINELKIDNHLNNLKSVSKDLAIKYGVKNPIYSKDSTTHFNQILSGDKNAVLVSDSINKIWILYEQSQFENKLYHKKADMLDENLKVEKKYSENNQKAFSKIILLGFIFFLIGLFVWMTDENVNTEVKQSDKIYKWCQSCGKSFNSMKINGLNKNGEQNLAFCQFCYDNGEFTSPNLTKEDFLSQVNENLESKSWLTKRLVKARLNNLERWKKDIY